MTFGVVPQTYSAGWDLSGSGQPPGCTAQPADTPVDSPVDTPVETPVEAPSAVPVASPNDAAATPVGSGSIARTGRFSDRLAVIGALSIVVGLGAVLAGRSRREPVGARFHA